jgi:hypothetical protein
LDPQPDRVITAIQSTTCNITLTLLTIARTSKRFLRVDFTTVDYREKRIFDYATNSLSIVLISAYTYKKNVRKSIIFLGFIEDSGQIDLLAIKPIKGIGKASRQKFSSNHQQSPAITSKKF